MYIASEGSNFAKALSAAISSGPVKTPKSSYNSCVASSFPLYILLPAPGGGVFKPPAHPPNLLNIMYAGLMPRKVVVMAASNTAESTALAIRDCGPSGFAFQGLSLYGTMSSTLPSSGLLIPSGPNVKRSGNFFRRGSTPTCKALSNQGEMESSTTLSLCARGMDMKALAFPPRFIASNKTSYPMSAAPTASAP